MPRIILLEDEDLIRFSLSTKLSKLGFEVMSFSDPTQSPVFFEGTTDCPLPDGYRCGDFLLTDNRMPNMTGLEFIELQLNRGCRGIAKNIAIMSAFWSKEDIEKAQLLGCEIFQKPCEFEKIKSWLTSRERNLTPDKNFTFSTKKEN